MIDFPVPTFVGQKFNPGTGSIYTWDGVAWNLAPVNVATANRKNLILNGSLIVSQENAASEGTTNTYYAADQFASSISASGAAIGFQLLITQDNPSGSTNRLRYRVTTAKGSLAAADIAAIVHRIEGIKALDLNWDGAVKNDAVLRFMVNMPAGTYTVAVRNYNATHCCVIPFTITAAQANTDQLIVLTVPAPPSNMNDWQIGTNTGVEFYFTFASGSTYVAPANGWNSANYIAAPSQSNGLATVQAFQMWDLGFHADPLKTRLPPDFEVPDYTDELARCKRYWTGSRFSGGPASGSTRVTAFFSTVMRTTPTVSLSGGTLAETAAGQIIVTVPDYNPQNANCSARM